ncbi:MAG: hypothetical protein ACK2UW_03650 [Anaerolineales bacterium]|jgi:hypothetical protein
MKPWEYCLLTEIWISDPYSTRLQIEFPNPADDADFLVEGLKLVDAMNKLGEAGWEAVTFDNETVEHGTVTKVLFKRELHHSE